MINQFSGFFVAQRQWLNRWSWPLTGLLLTVGLISPISSLKADALQMKEQATDSTSQTRLQGELLAQEGTANDNPALTSDSNASIPDGTYLYGQSSEPEQIGTEYIVFEARHGKLIGALYLPQSEFSCFYGTIDSQQMNLTVVNPYDQTAFSHSIAREQPSQIAAVGDQLNLEQIYDSLKYPHNVGLEGYQPIGEMSENDQRILSICRQNYQETVWN